MKSNKEFTDSVYRKVDAARALEEQEAKKALIAEVPAALHTEENISSKVVDFKPKDSMNSTGKVERKTGSLSKKKIYRYVGSLAACLVLFVGVGFGSGLFDQNSLNESSMSIIENSGSNVKSVPSSQALEDAAEDIADDSNAESSEESDSKVLPESGRSTASNTDANDSNKLDNHTGTANSGVTSGAKDISLPDEVSEVFDLSPVDKGTKTVLIAWSSGGAIEQSEMVEKDGIDSILSWLQTAEVLTTKEVSSICDPSDSYTWPSTLYAVCYLSGSNNDTPEVWWINGNFPYVPDIDE